MNKRWRYCGIICCFENMEGLYRRSWRRRNCYLEMTSYIILGKTRMDGIWYMQIQVDIVVFQTLNFCIENLFGVPATILAVGWVHFIGHICTKLGLIYDQSTMLCTARSFMLFWKQATVQAAEDLAGGGLGCCLPSQKWIDLSHMRNCGHEWSVAVDAGGAKMLVAAAIRQGLPGIWCLSVDCLPCTKSDKSLGLNFCASCECACGSRWLGPDNALSDGKICNT